MNRVHQIKKIINGYIKHLENNGKKPSEIELQFLKFKAEHALVDNSDGSIKRLKRYIEEEKKPTDREILAARGISVQIVNKKITISAN